MAGQFDQINTVDRLGKNPDLEQRRRRAAPERDISMISATIP
jgi:hypothetical protein